MVTCIDCNLSCRKHSFQPRQLGGVRAWHPGASDISTNQLPKDKEEVGGWKIVKAMLGYVWPKDQPALRFRVVTAFSLLVGAKVRIK